MKNLLKILCAVVVVMVLSSGAFAMTDGQKAACHVIIHTTTATATGLASVSNMLPGADNVYLAINVGLMTVELAFVFDLSFGKAAAETIGTIILSHFKTKIAARLVSQWTVGLIPLLGNAVNAATMAYLLEDIGWSIADAFDNASSASFKIGTEVAKDIAMDEFEDLLKKPHKD